jgi:DMSO/TMAO reductase YedYZ heme-binding membrane subunit
VKISPAQALVPFASPWRPVAIAWAAIALWLMVFIEVTALARKYMARRTWHAIHLASYALAVLATIHGITAGTDTAAAPVRWVMAGIVLFATVVSVMRPEYSAPITRLATSSTHATSPLLRAMYHQVCVIPELLLAPA